MYTSIIFFLFLLVFVFIGIISSKRLKTNQNDFWTANFESSSIVVALSAGASAQSGFLWLGIVGSVYTHGFSSLWMLLGWSVGDLLTWQIGIQKKIRVLSKKNALITLPSLIAAGDKKLKLVSQMSAYLCVFFLVIYMAGQFTAAGKSIHFFFGMNYYLGIIICAICVFLYSSFGGMRASLWTDVFQSILMLVSTVILAYFAINECGGIVQLIKKTKELNPDLLNIRPSFVGSHLEFFFFISGWMLSGIGIIGQPHVMSRIITIKEESQLNKARNYYFFWTYLLILAVFVAGLSARLILGNHLQDQETAYLSLAKRLLPNTLSALVFSGLIAAILSTLDSMLLSISSIISYDIIGKDSIKFRKMLLLSIIVASISISFFSLSVFSLVMTAWPILAATLAPLVLLRSFDSKFLSSNGLQTLIISLVAFCVARFIGGKILNEVTFSFFITSCYYLFITLSKNFIKTT